ncbi:MAG: hypothetical protein HY754_15795 [Nitrospirae bacterium]|nr:hypothetical protein [Nitrospirota bacterium]
MTELQHPGDVTEWSYRGILDIFKEHIEKSIGIKALIEPQPVKLQEPNIRIMAPTGWDFGFKDFTTNETARLYTVQLDMLVTLTAYGDGPDVYLDKCIQASFNLNKYFMTSFPIPVAGGKMSVQGRRKPGGQHFKNEDAGNPGEKPYLYEENFEVSIFFPYAELI